MKRIYFILLMLLAAGMAYAQKEYTKTNVQTYYKGQTYPDNNSYKSYKHIILGLDADGRGYYKQVMRNGFESTSYDDAVDRIAIEAQRVYDVSDEERAALMDFYNATDGPHWKQNDGWGTDRPVEEWYGVYTTTYGKNAYVKTLRLENNNLTGTIPASLQNLSELNFLELGGNNLTGTVPAELASLKNLYIVELQENKFNGPFPEHPFVDWMNSHITCTDFRFFNNNFSYPIPEWATKHERFWEFWPDFIWQQDEGYQRIVDSLYIEGPKYQLTDFAGKTHWSAEDYPNNKLTILYRWETWCPYSKMLSEKLKAAYNRYKNDGLEILGIVTGSSEEPENYVKENGITWPNALEKYYAYSTWDYENNNIVIPMRLFGGVPKVFAIDKKGKLVFQSFYQDYNNIIPLIESMFGPVDTEYYTSTDYSKDGEVVKLQTATTGKGIDIVFIGEAFVDKDMVTGGKYEQKMKEAMEQFFAMEPYTSLRNRFNVYAVKAVSPNDVFGKGAVHAINENDAKAFDYARKALGDSPERIMVGVVYNSGYAIDRDHCSMYMADGSFVAYMYDGVGMALNHEMGGHGFALLYDEYVEPGNEGKTLPDEQKTELDNTWEKYGAGANVDYHKESAEVKWAKMLTDPRYTNENLGVIEGAYLYEKGAYRPSENSMMRHSDSPFNAPSREAIYKRVMQYSEQDWTYDYEKFVEFDSLSRAAYSRRAARENKGETVYRHRQPTLITGSWRHAYK